MTHTANSKISKDLAATDIRPKIRCAVAADAEQMAALFMRCWQINLKEFTPDGFIDQFSHEIQKQKYIQRARDPNWIIFVAESGDKIVGTITGRDNPVEPSSYQKEVR